MPKVTGMSRATAMVAVRPGMAPIMTPPTVPKKTASSGAGAQSVRAASTIISMRRPPYSASHASFAFSSEPTMSEKVNSSKIPRGTGTFRNFAKTP